MKKVIQLLIPVLFISTAVYAQVGINTTSPQGVFHIDGAKDNPATGVPTTVQQANDVVVTNTGALGVGTAMPNVPLHVFQNSSSGYVFRVQNNAVNTGIYIGNSNNNDGVGGWIGSVSNHNFYLMANNIGAMIINPSNSTIKPMNGYTISTSSDRRLKKEIQPITMDNKSADKINELMPVQYKMNDNKEGRVEFGFIAQDLEKIYPNLVFTDEKGYKSVNYSGLIPILTAELKKQKSEIEELKTEIKRLIKDRKFK